MKRFLIINGPLGGGGAERVLLDILHHFDYTKYQLDLCLLCPGGILFDEIPNEVNLISLYSKYTKSFSIAYHLSNDFGIDFLLKKKLRRKLENKYDVVISFLEGLPLKLHALTALNARHYSWIHCDLFNFPYEKNQFRKGEELRDYNMMDEIICVSIATAEAFKKRFPKCTSEVKVIYNPIDLDKISYMSREKNVEYDKFTTITVGRLTPPKRMDRVIRLAKRLKDENINNIQFIIIGDGELHKELNDLINNLDVRDMIKLMGFTKNPFPYIRAAHMMFIPSSSEGFSLVACEAMTLGVPILSTKTAGPSEILKNNEYGLLCEQDDESIYNAFIQIYKQPELRKKYAIKGTERVDDFNIAKTMLQIYKL